MKTLPLFANLKMLDDDSKTCMEKSGGSIRVDVSVTSSVSYNLTSSFIVC